MPRDPLIYALTETNGDVRYIGKSVNGVVRAFKHFQPAQMARKCHRNSWLKSLQERGEKAGVQVLERFPSAEDLNDAERFWIAQGKGLGWRLTNHTDGGDGNAFPVGNRYAAGRTKSATEIAAMRERAKRLWADPEWRMKTLTARGDRVTPVKGSCPKSVPFEWTPEKRAAQGARLAARWADPEWRAKITESMRRYRARGR